VCLTSFVLVTFRDYCFHLRTSGIHYFLGSRTSSVYFGLKPPKKTLGAVFLFFGCQGEAFEVDRGPVSGFLPGGHIYPFEYKSLYKIDIS
jgi:hypothetical protein